MLNLATARKNMFILRGASETPSADICRLVKYTHGYATISSSSSEPSSHSSSAAVASAVIWTFCTSASARGIMTRCFSHLFETAEFFHVSWLIQGALYELPAIFLVRLDNSIRASAAVGITSTDDRYVLKR